MTDAACPICHRALDKRFAPFCSKRCADIDLGRWLTAQYVAPGEAAAPALPDEQS